jgi:ABC-type Mn2+/Zn2+ transport system ATPase subunit
MTNSIVTEHLTKRFGTVTAVNGIDLVIQEGTVFGLLGPNGAGKTTTVHILATLVGPDAGRDRPPSSRGSQGTWRRGRRTAPTDHRPITAKVFLLTKLFRAHRMNFLRQKKSIRDHVAELGNQRCLGIT